MMRFEGETEQAQRADLVPSCGASSCGPSTGFARLCIAALGLLLVATIAAADLPQIMIEAEGYTEAGGQVRVLTREGASGGKCVSYWEEPGVAVTCAFEVAEAGEYCLTLGYSLQWPDTRREVRVDGETVPGLEDVLLPGTGTWNDFSAVTLAAPNAGRVRIALQPGAHTLTLTNVDSRGLAWDFAILHDPEDLLADVPLSEEELRGFADALPATARRLLLDGPAEGDLALGNVAVAFSGGVMQGLRIGDVFFAQPAEVDAPLAWEHDTVGPVSVATIGGTPEPGHALRGLVATDGDNLLVVMAGTGENTMSGGQAGGLPGPLIVWRDGRPWRLAVDATERQLASAELPQTLALEDLVVSASGTLSAEIVPGDVPCLSLGWAPVQAGSLKVAALRIGPARSPGDWTVSVMPDEDGVVVRPLADVTPALARFYGIPQFIVRVRPDVSMSLVTETGDTLELPAQ